MLSMKNGLWLALVLCLFTPIRGVCQEPIRATIETGKAVLLMADGTWKYDTVATAEVKPTVPAIHTRPKSATATLKTIVPPYSLFYDEAIWKMTGKPDSRRQELVLIDGDGYGLMIGDGYGLMISERLGPIEMGGLKEIVVNHLKESGAMDVKIVKEEKRKVNGHLALCLQMTAPVSQLPIVYYGYYYSDKNGTIQVVTYTSSKLFAEYKDRFTGLLDGLQIKE